MARIALPAAALLALLAASPMGAAQAHALLRRADPPVGGTVAVPPTLVAIDFTEELEPRFSTIAVADAAGVAVDRHDVHTAPNDAKRLIVGLLPLRPGLYRVTWHAVSVDTHRTEGSFSFTLAR